MNKSFSNTTVPEALKPVGNNPLKKEGKLFINT